VPIMGRGRSPSSIRRGGDGVPAIQVWHNGVCLYDGTMPATVFAGATATVLVASGIGDVSAAAVVTGGTSGEITWADTGETSTVTAGGTAIGGDSAQVTLSSATGSLVAGAVVAGGETAEVIVASGSGMAGTALPGLAEGGTAGFVVFMSGTGAAVVAVTVEALSSGAVAIESGAGSVSAGGVVTGGSTATVTVSSGTGAVGAGATVAGTGSGAVSISSGSGTVIGEHSFLPVGMTKSGTQTLTVSWAPIVGWDADTTNYPASVVSGDALVAFGGGPGKTVSAAVAFTGANSYGGGVSVRIKQNGTIIGTGTAVSGVSGTATCTVTGVTVSDGDQFTAEAQSTKQYFPGTISAGTATYLRVTNP